MVCRVSLIGTYTPIAVWHILGVLPGGRGCPCPCYPYYLCNHSSSSLTPNRIGNVSAMPAAIIRSVLVIEEFPPIKIVLNLFFVLFHYFPLLLLLYYTLLLLGCLLLLCQVVVKFFLFISSAIISLPPERVPWFQSKDARRIVPSLPTVACTSK